MRVLKTSDIGKASKFLKKMDIKLEGSTQEEVGANLIMSLLENYHLAEREFAEFISDLKGITAEEWLNQELDVTIEDFNELIEQPGLSSFFKLVGKIG